MSVSYGGVTLEFAEVIGGAIPWRQKEWSYPGNDGVEALGMGKGKRTVTVRFRSTGSPSRSTMEALVDGTLRTLSANGESYGNCKLMAVALLRKVNTTDGYLSYFELTFQQEVPD